MFNAKTTDKKIRQFLDLLTTACTVPAVVPYQIADLHAQSSTSKGFGDDPRTVGRGSVLSPSADLAHCHVTLMPLPALATSSR